MTAATPWSSVELATAVGWTLLHSFWQAAVLWLATAAFRRRVADPLARSRAADFAIALLLGAQSATIALCLSHAVELPTPFRAGGPIELDARGLALRPAAIGAGWLGTAANRLDQWMPLMVAAWAACCLARLVGYACGARAADRALAAAPELPPALLEICRSLAARLGVAAPVRFVAVALGEGPGTVGWLRPYVFIPPALLLSMTPAQVEAVVAHELAHVLRRDYLSAALRLIVEAIYAANPFVRWIVAGANEDAESCCDRVAVRHLSDPLSYAKALAMLAERAVADRVALRATGGALMRRVGDVLRPPAVPRVRTVWGRATASATVAAAGLLLLSAAAADAAAREREADWFSRRTIGDSVMSILAIDPVTGVSDANPRSADAEVARELEAAVETARRGADDAATRLRAAIARAAAMNRSRPTVRLIRAMLEPSVLDRIAPDSATRGRLVRAATYEMVRSNELCAASAPARLDQLRDAEFQRLVGSLALSPISQNAIAVDIAASPSLTTGQSRLVASARGDATGRFGQFVEALSEARGSRVVPANAGVRRLTRRSSP